MSNEDYLEAINNDDSEYIAHKTVIPNEYGQITDYYFKDGALIRDTFTYLEFYQSIPGIWTTMPKHFVEIIAPVVKKAVIYKDEWSEDLPEKGIYHLTSRLK